MDEDWTGMVNLLPPPHTPDKNPPPPPADANSSLFTGMGKKRVAFQMFLPTTPITPRTVFYLEYKLAKLLLCPLDEKYPASRYAIRGYSRQSDSAGVSSIPSRSSTRRQSTGMPSHELLRLPSQTRSTPACLGRFASLSGQISIEASLEFPGVLSLGQSPVTDHPRSSLQLQRLLSDSSTERTNGRLMSGCTSPGEPEVSPVHLSRAAAPTSSPDPEFTERCMAGSYRKPFSGPRKVLQFDLNETSSTKEELQDSPFSPGFGNAALQQLKEDILGTRAGMDNFREFLHGTLGIYLLDFWIDCEDFMAHTRHLEARATPQETQLFFCSALRSIQAKYQLTIPPAAQEELGAGAEETAFAAVSRKQYDALRRLRCYWVPRFLIHHQRTRQLRWPKGHDELYKKKQRLENGQFRKDGISEISSTEQLDLPEDPFETLTTTRFLQILMCDLGDGDSFLHYLTRFEDPQEIHNLWLWRKLKLYEMAWEHQASPSEVHQIALEIFHTFLASYATCSTGLSSSLLEYIHRLERMLSIGSGDLKPSTFEPVIRYVLAVLGRAWLHYLHHEVTTFLEHCVSASHLDAQSIGSKGHRVKQERIKKQKQNFWFYGLEVRGRHRKRGRKKAAPMSHRKGSADQGSQDAPTPPNVPDLLSNPIVFNVYRKAAQKMRDVELQRVLGLLQEVEACQEATESKKRLGCVMKLLDMWGKLGTVGLSVCLPKELKMRLEEEVAQGEISDFSWNEIRLALRSFVAPAFERFWDEVGEGLKKHGVQPSQIPEESWSKLEPFLHTIAAKVALRRLRSRKARVGSAATAQPTQEDKASFLQSLRKAAEGWPTIEMLHFLKHLQVHGPPVLESGLHFLLEVQKFKNAHHPWPDMALLKTKVLVIRDCFLASPIEPQLQVAVDAQRLGRVIRAAEQALQKEIPAPPPNLFDELRDSVFSILLPYWAGFQKHWLKRSPASAQKAPVLRNQLLLQKRRVKLEGPRAPPQPLRLPRRVQGSRCQDALTYTFSISEGLTLQDTSKEGTSSIKNSSSVFGKRKKSTGFQFPSLPNVPVQT
ncbi:uncharacterized protein LOC134398158 [Elgaria multicarinata webbii]|uniref:uncharacterized protein LOC134398158 n=1 Tax=Elgaria multicarinata webbii TaxID=159646 RepID=UPI002FCD6158